MYRRGELKMKAEERARASYVFKKGVSRSQFLADEKAPKRQKVSADERKQKITSISSDLELLKKQVNAKQNLISKASSTNDFQLCDKLHKELRELMTEKSQLEQQLKVLKKKEAKSKWYMKTKSTKEISSSGKAPTVALSTKTAYSSLDIRSLFPMRNATPSGAASLPANLSSHTAVASGTFVVLTGNTETDTSTETKTSTYAQADDVSSTGGVESASSEENEQHEEKGSFSFLELEALI